MDDKKIKRETIGEHLVDKQLSIIGKTRMDILDDDRFFFNNTMTQQQLLDFKKYSVALIQKIFHCRKSKAEEVFESFRTLFGVRIKN